MKFSTVASNLNRTAANTFFRITAALCLILGVAKASASVFEAECPEEVKTRQAALPTPKGWSAHVEGVSARQIFTGLELYSGHPKDGAPLFPDEAAAPVADKPAAGAPETPVDTTYTIPVGRETYVSCQYTNTIVRLIGKIPKTAKTCRVRFSESLGHVQKVICD